MPILTYRCRNPRCGDLYDTTGTPRCPKCKSARASWVPQRVSIGKSARAIDRDLRGIADSYGLSDLRSAKAGESAAPRAPNRTHTSRTWTPPGLSPMNVNVDANGTPIATAAWTGDTVKFTPSDMARPLANQTRAAFQRNTTVVHKEPRKVS